MEDKRLWPKIRRRLWWVWHWWILDIGHGEWCEKCEDYHPDGQITTWAG